MNQVPLLDGVASSMPSDDPRMDRLLGHVVAAGAVAAGSDRWSFRWFGNSKAPNYSSEFPHTVSIRNIRFSSLSNVSLVPNSSFQKPDCVFARGVVMRRAYLECEGEGRPTIQGDELLTLCSGNASSALGRKRCPGHGCCHLLQNGRMLRIVSWSTIQSLPDAAELRCDSRFAQLLTRSRGR